MEQTEFDIRIVPLRDRLYRFARTLLGRGDEAEDVVHDVLERLWRRHESLHVENPKAFAMTAVRNAAVDRLRRSRTTEELPLSLPADEQTGAWSDREMVRRALALLPLRQREVLHLKEIEGYPTHEIAALLTTDEAQVRVLLSRGRMRLRRELEKLMNYGI